MTYDSIVVGAGPNGLAAAIALARAGRSVLVLEAGDTIGGGMRSAELTLPGYLHDVCSAIHPLSVVSPFFRTLPLEQHGLEWIYPPAELAHPMDDGTAVLVERSVETTSRSLGPDAAAYRRLMSWLAGHCDQILADVLGPFRFPPYPLALAIFGLPALCSASLLAKTVFRGKRARAVFAGIAAHSILPLERPISASFGLILGMLAHAVGWPVARGGSQQIAKALASYLRSLGGEIVTGHPVQTMDDIDELAEPSPARAILFDVTPRQLLRIMSDQLPPGYRKQLENYRYGPGVYKIDFALDGPIPWRAAECSRAATVHLGGPFDEIATGERAVWRGEHPDRPFVLLAQQSLFDPLRAPAGKHTAWAYCHVPNGSSVDMSARIEAQIERFAPGFRDRVLVRAARTASQMEAYNANYVGGDINGGVEDLGQLFTRPVARLVPYATPQRGVYLCSSSTPPGGGVHGMCGYFAAQAALRTIL